MTKLQELKDLALHAAKGTAPANFTVDEANEGLRKEINDLAKDFNLYRRNKLDIFEIVQLVADEIVPNRVLDIMGQFAEIKSVANGVRASFKLKKGRVRAKAFITRAAVSGIYETFRLDTDTIEVLPLAYGGAAYIDFERFLSGDEVISDYMDIIVEGLVDAVLNEVQSALQASVSVTRPANTVYSNTWDGDQMATLLNTVRAYGTGAVIYATPEFVASMGADAVMATTYSLKDIDEIRDTGFVSIFRGAPIVRLPQSFTDIDNATKVINPDYAYIFPTGGQKAVKIVIEGNTVVTDFQNRDNSFEIQAYKKFGVAITTYYNWAVYYNAALS